MKVSRGEVFDPITIVIETEKEADYLWHLLCCSRYQDLATFAEQRRYALLESVTTDVIWATFDLVHKPKNKGG